MWGASLVVFMGAIFVLWFLVVRPGDKAHHERRLELIQKRIRASEARQRQTNKDGETPPAREADDTSSQN